MGILELVPTDGRKSFYGKAKVLLQDNDVVQLLSYETIVAEYSTKKKEFKEFGKYSRTTDRHVKAFKNLYNL
jgi:hypothetical protein